MEQILPGLKRSAAGQRLEQVTFTLLMILGCFFAFEQRRPLIETPYGVLTNVETIALLVFLCWLAMRLAAGSLPRLPQTILLPGLAWLTILFISAAVAPSQQDKTVTFMGRVLSGTAIGMVTYDLTRNRDRRLKLICALALGTVLVAGFGLVEGFGPPAAVAWLDGFKEAPTRVGGVLRVSSTLSYATITAMVLELILPLLLALLLIARKRFWRLLLASGILLILFTHVLTLSRGGIIALLAAFGLIAAAGWLRRERWLSAAALLSAALLILLFALVLTMNPLVRLRLISETEQSWYRANYAVPESAHARSGELLAVPVEVTNDGQRSWVASGENFFALAYHLFDATGESITFDGERTFLPQDVAPGETVELMGLVRVPGEPGTYRVEWDMVQEAVSWFSWEDVPTAETRLVVQAGAPDNSGELAQSVPPTDIRVITPTPGRIELWRAALQMAADHPLWGVGPDNFRWRFGDYAGLKEWNTGIHANNLYLEWLADTGAIGLLAFLWLSWSLVQGGYSRLRALRDRETWLLALGLTAGLATWYVHGFFDYFYEFTPTYLAFWMVAGLLTAVPLRR